MAKKSSANTTGRNMAEVGRRDRRLTHGPLSVEVRNTYPAGDGVMISGICEFVFKNPRTEAMENTDECDLSDAAVPSGSVLIFRPSEDRCVSSFHVDLVIKKGDGSEETTFIEKGDKAGRCWSSARFDCGP